MAPQSVGIGHRLLGHEKNQSLHLLFHGLRALEKQSWILSQYCKITRKAKNIYYELNNLYAECAPWPQTHSHNIIKHKSVSPRGPTHIFKDGKGGLSDFFGSEILAKSDLLGHEKKQREFLGMLKKVVFFWVDKF